MQWGIAVALVALLSSGTAMRAEADTHRLYDHQTDCAVFDTEAFSAERATWDGPCTHGVASGRGTATFFAAGGRSETVSAAFIDGMVSDGKASIDWSSGAHYEGGIAGGVPNGTGVLTDAGGNRYDGIWKNGLLNGSGSVLWANGNRYDGDWVAGKAEGHGVKVWADGRKYDGEWRGDLPNGRGMLTARDGSTVTANFIDGERQVVVASSAPSEARVVSIAPPPTADTPSPPVPETPAPLPPNAAPDADPMLAGFDGKTLVAVDGSTATIAGGPKGLVLTVVGSDGAVQKSAFFFAGKGVGTVSDAGDPPQVNGVFHETSRGLLIDFADGRSETLTPAADGLTMSLSDPSGALVCAAWFPKGHAFSTEERKAAVAAYAKRLGVADASSAASDCGRSAAALPAAPAAAIPVAVPAAMAAPSPSQLPVAPHKRGVHGTRQSALQLPYAAGLQNVPVKPSTVHLIDAPGDAIVAPAGIPSGPDEAIASNCLKVDSDGSYWGFRNHCGYAVQFAYCVLRGQDRMTACGGDGAISVPGSVSANGFGALFADDSLGERGVEHSFRWVGCKGGAGEVSAHLDTIEPASGHCDRADRTVARQN